MRRVVALLMLLFSLFFTAHAADKLGSGGMTTHKFKHKGVEYTYYLYIPQNLKPGAPLLMVFHGYGSKDIPSLKYGFNPVADREGFAVCYPCGPADHKGKHYWSVGYEFHIVNNEMRDDVGMAVRLVKHLQRQYNLSKHNVFATGHSNGGAMSYMLAYQAPDTFAAVAPVSGHVMRVMYTSLKPKKPVPLMEIHGTDDPLSLYNGDPYNKDSWGADIAIPCAVAVWITENRCTHELREQLPLLRNQVIAHRFVDGIGGNQVWFYRVIGGKHSWADSDMDTPNEIWKFFSLYIK